MSVSQKPRQAILYTFFLLCILWFCIQLIIKFLICSVDAEQFLMWNFTLLLFAPA